MDNHEKNRYSDVELQEFKEIILEKLQIAREELGALTQSLSSPNVPMILQALIKPWKMARLPWKKSKSTNWLPDKRNSLKI